MPTESSLKRCMEDNFAEVFMKSMRYLDYNLFFGWIIQVSDVIKLLTVGPLSLHTADMMNLRAPLAGLGMTKLPQLDYKYDIRKIC